MALAGNIAGVKDRFATMLRSLKHRNYRLFFMGQGLSLVGTWMQTVAMSWLVYRLTDSAFYLGVLAFVSQLPTFFLAPVAGVLADRLSKRNIVIVTQVAAMAQALVLTALAWDGHANYWMLVVLATVLGVINGFDIPTRQSLVYELVDKPEDLPNAIALNSLIFNSARLVGPSIAGVVVYYAGEAACFLVNAVSFGAVIVSLCFISIKRPIARVRKTGVMSELAEGFGYAANFMPIRTLLILLAFMSLTGMSYGVLLPVYARDILHGGPQTLGFLMGSVGIGALVGAVFLASRKSVLGLGRVIVGAIVVFSLGAVAFAYSNVFWVSMGLISLLGFGLMVQMASCNTLLQTITADDKRGRVMALYTMAFIGTTPVGSLLIGLGAKYIGAQTTLAVTGGLCMAAAAVFASKLPKLRKQVHPIYVEKGIRSA
ncbi:MAG: MFS transporter [Planctomycetes bacterium GWF2_50_10]|nr:MAG: MFS transporter [Planctomycetes bacterium GWF2_50_10]